MAGVSSRIQPKFAVLTFVVLAAFFYLFSPFDSKPAGVRIPYDPTLRSRLAQSDAIYDRVLEDRKGLIKKFGPTPADIAMFPPDKEPWPAYTFWDFFPAAYNCPHDIQRLGALGDGGKWVCGITRVETKPDCVVYSFGINLESSFEAEILRNTHHCQIWGYDFSVKSFGPEIPWRQKHRTHFFPYKLGGEDQSAVGDEPPMFTLGTLMKKNGHTHIDILKVDIEGWEFGLLETLINPYMDAGKPLPFGQLQLEIHAWDKSFEYYLKWWEMLEDAGLRPFWTEPNLVYNNYNRAKADLAEYSFLNVKGDNIFIRDPPSARGRPL
ncbi:hypothetical protein PM082_021867 [Marasmius tenuissimus]|nr:hypothetical protein PM082_021867 [Marasmius tenuissimus]